MLLFEKCAVCGAFFRQYLGLKATSFYRVLSPSVACCLILTGWGFLMKLFLKPTGWLGLIAAGVIFVAVGVCLTGLAVLNREERNYVFNMIKSKLHR